MDQTRHQLTHVTATVSGATDTFSHISACMDETTEKVNEISACMDETTEKVNEISACMDETTEKVNDISACMDETTEKVNEISACMDETTEKVKNISACMDETTEKVIDLSACMDETTEKVNLISICMGKTTDELTNISSNVEETTDKVTQISACLDETTEKVTHLEDNMTQNVSRTQIEISRLETAVGDNDEKITQIKQEVLYTREDKIQGTKSDVKELKDKLVEVNNDTTKVIPLSPLQERGENELPIELIYASVVIRKDLKYTEKGHYLDSAPARTRSKLDSIKTFFKRLPGRMSSGGTSDGTPRDIREVTEPGDIFPPRGKVARDVYMLGDAAHGKTTYCLWLLKKWCNAQIRKIGLDKWAKALKDFHFVFLIQFRHVSPSRASVVDMICQDVFRRDKGCHATIRHVLSSDKYRSLIIMDGLDEWNPNDEARQQLTCPGMPNIEDVSSTTSCFFSMRPWVFPAISKNIKVRDRVVQIQGLSETGMMNVVQNVLINHYKLKEKSPQYTSTYENIEKHLESESLKSFMQIPLLAVVCVQIWYEGKQVGDSLTSFYAEMLNMLIERENQKHDIRIENDNTIDCELPVDLSKKVQIRKCVPILLKLGKVAYEGLLSKKRNVVFQKAELEKIVGVRELQFALDVGLISQKEADSITSKKVSVHFFHKSIQEFLAAICIVTNKEVGDSFCNQLTELQVIMELSNVIMFICGMCPPLFKAISQYVVSVTDSDSNICRYRESLNPDICFYSTIYQLYELQISWYRELQYRHTDYPVTDNQVTYHVSDACLHGNSNIETVNVTRKLISDRLVEIRSLYLQEVPADGECGIPNTQLNDFLCQKYNNTGSLVKLCIYGEHTDRTLHQISIPTLTYLNLGKVKLKEGKVCPPLLTCMASLRSLRLTDMTLDHRGLDLSDMTSLCELRLERVTLGDRGLDLSNMVSLCELQLESVTLGVRGLVLLNMTSLRELQLESVNMGDKGLDLYNMKSLRKLRLEDVILPIDRGLDLSDMTSLIELNLKNLTLTERGLYLPTCMVKIQKVSLHDVNMSAENWQEFILSLLNIKHTFHVDIMGTSIDDGSKKKILESPDFCVNSTIECTDEAESINSYSIYFIKC